MARIRFVVGGPEVVDLQDGAVLGVARGAQPEYSGGGAAGLGERVGGQVVLAWVSQSHHQAGRWTGPSHGAARRS